jgi:hypothetical protein
MIRISTAAVLALCGLSACTSQTGTNVAPEMSSASSGPSNWSQDQKLFLTTVFNAGLAGSNFYSEQAYIDMGNVVCDSLKADKPIKTVMAVIVATGRANGLSETDRLELSTTVTAAAVTYLCTDQLPKLTK